MKKDLFEKTLFLHRTIAKMGGYDVGLIPANGVSTMRMDLDTVDSESKIDLYKYKYDYSRYRTFELCEREIRRRFSKDQLSKVCVAEAGVADGNFSEIINDHFRECDCYLYDTFQGFSQEDMKIEAEKDFSSDKFIKSVDNIFKEAGGKKQVDFVYNRMPFKDKVIIREGYFPDTVKEEIGREFVFVSIDMDIYKPMFEGLKFFYPRLVEGGFIFVHDYNNVEYKGVRQALEEAKSLFGNIHYVPLCDHGGTCIIVK